MPDDEETNAQPAVPEAEGVALPDDVEQLKLLVGQERARSEDYRSQWLRARADYANLKRRTEEERAEASKFANAMLILSLLPVVDDLERALDHVSARLAGLTWVDGIALIYRKLKAVLEAQGLGEIKAQGERFDPSLHEAILFVEGEDGKIVEEVQKGYKLYDRVLRPSLVKVGGGTPQGQAGAGPPPQVQKEEENAQSGRN